MTRFRLCVVSVLVVAGSVYAASPAGGYGSFGSVSSVSRDVPISGDWDGNGSDTIGVFRAGTWYLRNANSSGGIDVAFGWGSEHDTPIAGDWNGDGIDSIGVFRNGTFYLRNSNSAGGIDAIVETDRPGAVPLAGDWDGDGVTTVGIWESGALSATGVPSQSVFSLWTSPASTSPSVIFSWGLSTDVPVAGDWDGDGTTTIGVFRAGTWFLRNSNSGGPIDVSFPWGAAGDVALAGDWDANGTSTIGVRRASTFYQRNSNDSGGVSATIEWGVRTVVEPLLPGATSTFYTNTAAHPGVCFGPDSRPYPDPTGVYPEPCFSPGPATGYSRLTAVTMAHNAGFDRIVYRFAGGFPLYRVSMAPPEIGHDPFGEFVGAGGAAVRLVFFGGGEWMLPPPFLPKTITGTTTAMTEARNVEDFEAVNIWLVGIDRPRAFRVIELTGPTRIVVDVQTDDFSR